MTAPQTLLHEPFGLAEFRPGQREVIDALLAGRSALAVFPTGGGKSLCYQLPALALNGVTLVVSPLIALMKDQIDALTQKGIAAARLDSTLTAAEVRDVEQRTRSGALKLLYVAPERFANERFLSNLSRAPIALFAVDEAHCISEWGHNFRPDYLKLAEVARSVGAQRVLALTATATPSVVQDICKAFQIDKADAVVNGVYRPNLSVALTPVVSEKRDALLVKRLTTRPPGSAIVYVTQQKTAERVAALLRDAGLDASAYHAGMDAELRSHVQEHWREAAAGIVVATIAFGMGIDKAAVRYVYHYNLPKSLESYSQEIGRAGRDGLPSTVEMLACPADVPTLENFAFGDTPAESALHSLLDDILARGAEFDVALHELSDRHDLRVLVLRTALTYLELNGTLRQGTPFYAGYEMRPLMPLETIADDFPGAHGQFVRGIFSHAKRGRTWYAVNPDAVAEALDCERKRIVRALQVLEERQFVELRAADVRQRYYLLSEKANAKTLAATLAARFSHREEQETVRLQQVLDLVTADTCQVNSLAAYFGQERDAPCGHCSYCKTGRAAVLPAVEAIPHPEVDAAELEQLRVAHPAALAEPRQMARFLCGLSSPALTKAKLGKHPLFAVWEERRFADVLNWCDSL